MATRRVYLVRHGEYDWDDQPSPLKGLTPRGVQQAQLTAKRLRAVSPAAIYSSDLARAVETAEIIASEFDRIPFKKRKNLRECFLRSPAFTNVPVEVIQAERSKPQPPSPNTSAQPIGGTKARSSCRTAT